MKQIDTQKIRTYNECTADEQQVLDSFRKMKLMFDQARYELFSYKLTDLLEKYEGLLEMRQETQALLFDVLEEIDQHGLSGIDVDYEKLGRNREAEEDNIAEEVNIVKEYKVAFDEGLALISSGAAEQAILDAENNW
ncbi:hypothetical protein [uncultured Methanobrevibacter sp.]|uniref:hypothetical protein n=1 Tax=uncultured Methanobrevibacter sp. TaxID=253161 RepID=UPI00320A0451